MVTYKINNCYQPCGYGDSGTILQYSLDPTEKSLIFQIQTQSSDITRFLQKNKFKASNGLTIDISEYPEYKESTLTIFLRGGNSFFNTKPDATSFYSNKVRDHREKMIRAALRELVSHVKKLSSASWSNTLYRAPWRKTQESDYVCFPTTNPFFGW